MNGIRRLHCALLTLTLMTLLAVVRGAPALADDAEAPPTEATDERAPGYDGSVPGEDARGRNGDALAGVPSDPDVEARARWQDRAAKARLRVEKAQARIVNAEDAYANMRQRNYPRGDAAAAIEREVDASKRELAQAEAALAALADDARAAQVPPAWIEPD